MSQPLHSGPPLGLWQLVRALVWMRWRRLVNGTRNSRRGDAFEHLSRVIGAAVPFLFVVTMVPTALLLGFGGWLMGAMIADAAQAGSASARPALIAVRVLLLLLFFLVVFAPLLRSTFSANEGLVRLLLLPISRRLLHGGEVVVALSDPWLGVVVPGLLLAPLAAMIGGAPLVGVLLAVLAILLVGTLLVASACAGSLCALLFRDRRRAELATLVVMVVISVTGLVPALLTPPERPEAKIQTTTAEEDPGSASGESADLEESASTDGAGPVPGNEEEADEHRDRVSGAERRSEVRESEVPESEVPESEATVRVDLLDRLLPPGSAVLPSELFWRGARDLSTGSPGRAAVSAAGLLGWFLALYVLSWRLFVRRVGQPESQSGRRGTSGTRALEGFSIPGISAATSAVAWASARSALRTVRGKIAVGLNFIIVGLTYVILMRTFEAEPLPEMGVAVGLAGLAFCLLSLQPVLYNQFAIDRTGLTLQLLSPLSTRDLVRGKLLGGALLLAPAFGLCLIAALLAAPGGSPLLWLATLPAASAAYVIYGAVGIVMSATFARAARLERMGSAGNPHSLAGLVATVLAALVILPPLGLGLLALRWVGSSVAALFLTCLWAVCCGVLAVPLVRWAEHVVHGRRENLLLVATER